MTTAKDSAELGATGGAAAMKARRARLEKVAERPLVNVDQGGPPADRWGPPDIECELNEAAVLTIAKAQTQEPPRSRARLVRASEVTPRKADWLWQGRIPFGMVTLVDGDPGLGKSTLTLDLVARVTRGDVMPDGGPWVNGGNPCNAIVLMLEDALDVTIRPRLDAAKADPERVFVMTGVRDNDADADTERPPILPADVAMLREAIIEHQARVVIIDPLMAYLGTNTDSHKDQDIRRALTPLARIAEDTNAAIIIVRHLRKSGGPALYRGGGSIGIMGAARTALFLARDPADPNARILAVSKSNIAKDTTPALRWRLVDTDTGVARAQWEGVAEGITADQLANVPVEASKPARDEDDAGQKEKAAIKALRALLADGPVAAKTALDSVMDDTGCSKATVRRARDVIGVIKSAVKVKGRVTGWTWTLPDESPGAHARLSAEES